jgi:nitrite reductase (NADH) small subunit
VTIADELGRIVRLGDLASIPRGEGRVFRAGPLAIAVFHSRNGGVFATEPWCPHRRGPLADGIVGEHKVICPLHARVFDLSSGEPIGNDCRAIKTYPVTINEEGQVLVDTSSL